MEGEIIVRETAVSPWIKQNPFEETEKWGGSYLQNIAKTRRAVVKAVPDDETFQEKIAQPAIDRVRKTLRDGMVNRKGLPKEAILKLMEAKMKRKGTAEKYRENLKKGYREFDQGDLNNAMVRHHLKKCFGVERFRDAIELANNRLAPFIIPPRKQGGFKRELGNQLRHSGKLISELAYDPKYLKIENDKINSLINKCLRLVIASVVPRLSLRIPPKRDEAISLGINSAISSGLPRAPTGSPRNDNTCDLVPFSTGGESHCDFVPIPGSVRPFDSKEVLDIKYEIYKHFLGEAQANRVRAVWTVKDYSGIQIDPNEYIGHPDKLAYFDMELNVQISKR